MKKVRYLHCFSAVSYTHLDVYKRQHEDLFKGLKVEKVVIPLPEEDQVCPVCGTQMVLILSLIHI